MKVILFGATGMVGQGALRECLLAPDVSEVLVIGRGSVGQTHAKLRERLLPAPGDLSSIEGHLNGYDACFLCLRVSARARGRRMLVEPRGGAAGPILESWKMAALAAAAQRLAAA